MLERARRPGRRDQGDLAAAVATLAARVEELSRQLDASAAVASATAVQVGKLEHRLWEVQNLVGRTYEQAHGWPVQLADARRDPGYERPYEGEPLVTVMVPTHDRAAVLCERALASVRRQTYERWEAVVVADECEDDTAERVRAIGDPRIRLIEHRRGEARPRDERHAWLVGGVPPGNVAIRAARGGWLARLDDDDALDDDALASLVEAAQRTRAEVVYSRLRVLGDGFATEIGGWPPQVGQFSWIGAIYHGALAIWERDLNCVWLDEPADWNLARRMLDAGVRFSFLDRLLGTYRPGAHTAAAAAWRELAAQRPLADGA